MIIYPVRKFISEEKKAVYKIINNSKRLYADNSEMLKWLYDNTFEIGDCSNLCFIYTDRKNEILISFNMNIDILIPIDNYITNYRERITLESKLRIKMPKRIIDKLKELKFKEIIDEKIYG